MCELKTDDGGKIVIRHYLMTGDGELQANVIDGSSRSSEFTS